MSQIKEMPLSLKSDTFSALSSDFDGMLRQLLQGMVDTGENSGTINIKVKVSLTEDSAPDFSVAGGPPTRSHGITLRTCCAGRKPCCMGWKKAAPRNRKHWKYSAGL